MRLAPIAALSFLALAGFGIGAFLLPGSPPEADAATEAPSLRSELRDQIAYQALRPAPAGLSDWMLSNVAEGLLARRGRSGPERKVLEVAEGDTLGGLLTEAGVDEGDAHAAVSALDGLYDPTRLKIGQPVTLTFDRRGHDRVLRAVTLMPEVDRTVTARRAPDGGFRSSEAEMELESRPVGVQGQIESSLYADATAAGVPDAVVLSLLQTWAYSVDFQRDLQPGDRFAVLFSQDHNADGSVARLGPVEMARLELTGKTLTMYRFESRDGTVDYYDRDGTSVRRLLLRTPVDGARLTSRFGARRHPILGYTRMHRGVDFGAARGTPIYAAGDGMVEIIGTQRGYGRYIRLRHSNRLSTAYAHMSRFAKLAKGARVRQGEVIGYVGATGQATGPHLHYEVLVGGAQVNPLSVDLPTGNTLEGRDRAEFRRRIEEIDRRFTRLTEQAPVAANPRAGG
ncbi:MULTISPECIES: peptidoglycan DD-metalloendopeptidase family protein [Inquilinus]|uniref:Murein DD-endopeptidase MepM/ murein hydrolase activator NlpD n=1 Tax=Inquilinus ginsengisoli TaxID=363840 RepID=A0ABU1JU97_9PROT|nr:peptidoglycan DD-metalloendopeptidase family protein [Inquilinus ginsengisoli]MDR6291867.1 murein DD-endopeptidase MepM/ murein hydrolase activator NlpD [Inquilinus ginsengisoli]